MMTLAQLEERIRVAKIIAEDAEKDAAGLDGQPFSGFVVATSFGRVLAQVQRLAIMAAELYEDRADELRALLDQAPPLLEPPADHVERP